MAYTRLLYNISITWLLKFFKFKKLGQNMKANYCLFQTIEKNRILSICRHTTISYNRNIYICDTHHRCCRREVQIKFHSNIFTIIWIECRILHKWNPQFRICGSCLGPILSPSVGVSLFNTSWPARLWGSTD